MESRRHPPFHIAHVCVYAVPSLRADPHFTSLQRFFQPVFLLVLAPNTDRTTYITCAESIGFQSPAFAIRRGFTVAELGLKTEIAQHLR